MDAPVSIPAWLLLILSGLALLALLDRILVPGVRWFLRQRTNRVIDRLNTRLRIQIPPFKITKREVLVERVVYHPRVMEAAEEYARDHGMPRDVAMSRVERYAQEIVPAFNAYLYFRIGYALARRVARMLYRVRLGYSDEEGLARIRPGSTVVFVMNHRSNMDYILVGYLAAKRAALSYAVGEWARIWPLQSLIRSMGAYFVRRRSGDELYRRVLEVYVHMATMAGVTQAVYPEGGLTRDGCLREPRLGLLDYMLRGFDPHGIRDIVFVPVGINYDRTLEDRSLLREKSETPPAGPLEAALTTARFVGHNLLLMGRNRWHRFGYACVNFGTPLSAREYVQMRGLDFRTMSREERAEPMAELGRTLMSAVGSVIPVLPVSVLATVFVREPHAGLDPVELKARVHAVLSEFEANGAHVYIPRRDREYTLEVGLRMLTLRHLVEERDGLLYASGENLPVLEYYANSVAHLLPHPTQLLAVLPAAPLPSARL
jgi:glycerol-3-phosphate O-acyltransferase